MMMSELDTAWVNLSAENAADGQRYEQLVFTDLLYRVYIGVESVPTVRYLVLEIPESERRHINTFVSPQGFTLFVGDPYVHHEHYVACVLRSSSSDQNDVFTVVAADILEALGKEKDSNKYIVILKHRIEKWRSFFKNPVCRKLPDRTVIGLFGELRFIQ